MLYIVTGTHKKLYVKTDVPQGAVLSPLIFFSYFNDISHNTVGAFINIFADDASLYTNRTDFSVKYMHG